MKRLEPNLLLAVSTGVALVLLVMTAGVFGRPDYLLRYCVIAVGFSACYVVMNTVIEKRAAFAPRPMILPDTPGTAVWALLIPILVLIAAAAPVILPGRDFALLVIIATVLFGLTVRSAMRAIRKA